jgi:putative thioredoxin
MKSYDNIINVNEADFEYQVIAYSQQVPVVVDFWAEWCVPCKTLGPMLEKLAEEADGDFRLAKINVDDNPNLARQFNIRSIPTVKAFRNGQSVGEFVGVLPEARLREFVTKLIPDESTLELERGNSLLLLRQIKSAETAFRKVLSEMPDSPDAKMGLARSLLFQGEAQEALEILTKFPVGKLLSSATTLVPLAEALNGNLRPAEFGEEPLQAAYQRALGLIQRSNIPAALDGLIDILREDKRFRNGEAHKVFLAILELLGNEDPLTAEYRRELANVLF